MSVNKATFAQRKRQKGKVNGRYKEHTGTADT